MFTKQDVSNAQNLMKLLAKAKMELEGLEVLAAAEAMKWYSNLVKLIEAEASKPTPPPPPVEVKQDKIEETKPSPKEAEQQEKKPARKK